MVVERAAPTASLRRSDAQNQPFQSHSPEQIEVFQPFHHVRPLVYQHVAEFDFADVGTTKPSAKIDISDEGKFCLRSQSGVEAKL